MQLQLIEKNNEEEGGGRLCVKFHTDMLEFTIYTIV